MLTRLEPLTRRSSRPLEIFYTRRPGTTVNIIIIIISTIWSPSLLRDIEQIEKVQRYTKRLRGMKHLSYNERLRQLDLPSLELRRLHLVPVFCCKVVFLSGVS